jgi:hypothetical protein
MFVNPGNVRFSAHITFQTVSSQIRVISPNRAGLVGGV